MRYTTAMRGRRIAGRYELLERLGATGWRATDTELERDVLVQLPSRAVVVAGLTHPSIVQVFDQGEEDGEPYAVYEYLSGGSLEQRLEAGSLGEAEAESVAADVSAALAYAHAQGVTHGSLGPASVLLGADGRAKVAGFAGDATPEDDERALGALLQTLGASAVADADVTAVLKPAASRGRRPLALIALAALVLLAAGVGAAFIATSSESKADGTTGSVSLASSTASTQGVTQPVVSPPATTSDETTSEQTTTEPATTTAPPAATTMPATTAPPTTTAPPRTTTEPPGTTEPPPPTTEPPPTAGTTAAETETTG